MVVRAIAKKFTKDEAKDLLDKGQKIIDEKIKGPALKEKKERLPKALTRDPMDVSKIDLEKGLEPKKIRKPSVVSEDKAEKLLFRNEENRLGYLIYRSNSYIFQPSDINDEKILLKERKQSKISRPKRVDITNIGPVNTKYIVPDSKIVLKNNDNL